MSKTEKLKQKLRNGTISAAEARTLLKKYGYVERACDGSHEAWRKDGSPGVTIATHDKDLKRYQIKQIQKALGLEEKDEDKADD